MRICLMQGKWVWPLVWEESACQGATKPMCHNYWACALEPSSCNNWTCSNSRPPSQWCHPTISSFAIPFSSCLLYFPASGSFPVIQFFASGGQSIGAWASAWVLPMNVQDWFLLGWTGLISLQSKALSRVFSNTTVQKHQFFSTRLSL